ncbi:hypothetical protein Y032_0170g245 [Ancylostoma ceylanicum]|uniref:Uncharacterized protein n=1 Tax=Ancylostoma ceylanicum TaxID=53326 RepID=A0A016SW36_9BILA|nr:hypothetical protein Y032_0170g245 [Ancylostoma ceylanicum]
MFVKFFISLGVSDQPFEKIQKVFARDRLKWKSKLFKALQRAFQRQSKAAQRDQHLSNDENRITNDDFNNELEN